MLNFRDSLNPQGGFKKDASIFLLWSMVIVEGVGGVLRSDFTKNQDIRYKKINKIKIKIIPTDRPFAKFAI